MTTTPTDVGVPTSQVEPKPDQPTPADRGAAILSHHVEASQEWGASSQATLTRILADLIAAADEDPDLSFPDALADAWRRLD
jgi:hypothetical protein